MVHHNVGLFFFVVNNKIRHVFERSDPEEEDDCLYLILGLMHINTVAQKSLLADASFLGLLIDPRLLK